MTNFRLILASASPRRRQLLKQLRIPFRVLPSHIPENSSHQSPIPFVRNLALRKARATAQKLKEGLVIGADTVVVWRGRIMSKPSNRQDAYRMLRGLSGSRHRVYTGVAIVDSITHKAVVSHAVSEVRMKKIPEAELRRLSRRHLDKAGSYAIQEKRDPIAKVVKGSYDNVVGLPVAVVKLLLKKLSRAV